MAAKATVSLSETNTDKKVAASFKLAATFLLVQFALLAQFT